MTLYFENGLKFGDTGSISLNVKWHPNAPLLAVASFSQDKGGFITIFDELGDSLNDNNYPFHRNFQITSLCWHPERITLATGWENGELKVWNESENDFLNFGGPHKAPITHTEFSEKGGRLVSCDSSGVLVGWKVDNKGQVVTSFQLDLKEGVTHVTFRLSVRYPEFDVEGLAKAAVNGDEQALDMFSNWRPKTTARKFRIQEGNDMTCFYVGTQTGSLYYINNGGTCAEVLNTEGVPLTNVLYHPTKDIIFIMMEGLTVGHFSIDHQGSLTEISKVKLNGKIQGRSDNSQRITWAGTNSLAILTGDLTARIWDIETNDNYVLPTSMKLYVNEEKNRQLNESFACISYCKLNQTICAGTNLGKIYFWSRRQNVMDEENLENLWELNNINNIGGTIKQLVWGSVQLKIPLLSVNCVTAVYIMKEQTICTAFSNRIWATQKTGSQVLLETEKNNSLLQLEIQVTDMDINENYAVFTNGRKISTYEINWSGPEGGFEHNIKIGDDKDFSVQQIAKFDCDNDTVLLYRDKLVILTQKGVGIRNITGSVEANIANNNNEGEAIGIDVNGNFLTIFTLEGFIKIYDFADKQPKLFVPVQNLMDLIDDFGEVIQARCNCVGNKVAMTVAAANLIPDGRLYVWDIETNIVLNYDFRKDDAIIGDDFEDEVVDNASDDDNKMAFDDICRKRIPLSLHWDREDPRLLICNAKKLKFNTVKTDYKSLLQKNLDGKKSLKDEDHIIITMFVSTENGIRMHDVKSTDTDARLVDISTPFIVTLLKMSIVRDVMSDFVGLENCNKSTRDAVLDFSYHLSLGNMDAAFKSIKLVQSKGVWNSLARMCVKTRRLDVAGVCLGHMGNARAARGLRLAIGDKSLPHEAKVAVLAVHLGMIQEAEQLYIECERFDLVNKLYQDQDKMEEAYSIAKTKDRIHLRNTEHAWARSLEQSGDMREASIKYEKANTHRYDVPRMLMDQPEELHAYMSRTTDSEMLKWWGQYVESQGDMATALKLYSRAADMYSQVRVLCYLGEGNKAADLARTSLDKAAFYHMARHYESVGNNEEAVNFFTKANAFSNAVRVCKENHMTEELWNIGMVASSREKIECAKYFEDIDTLDKAVILYHRAGMLHKALDLAFRAKHYDILQEIARDLDADSDPALVEKCADYFVTNEQFDKAVDLLAIAKKFNEAIQLCVKHNVQLTEDLTEKLSPDKDQLDEESRMNILETLAESLMVQGNYHLATKKFTQAGDKIRAMKALLKSGDTDKIVFFATVSRQREIYIMAANYLQSVDWQNQPEILRNIISFYSKGKALDLLANFYVACAQVEIDEFQNYEKAQEALVEASRCLSKIINPRDKNQQQKSNELVNSRLTLIKRFVDVKKLFDRGDIQGGLTQARQLLISGGSDLEASVRKGDIYGIMITHTVKMSNFTGAKQLFDELKQILTTSTNVPITYYVNSDVLQALAKGLNLPVTVLVPSLVKTNISYKNEGEIEEIIDD